MNIFVLDEDPERAAQYACNKHVVKMALESAQLLCSAHPTGTAPYKRTHANHPCSRWVRESSANYAWLLVHAYALCWQYTLRYGRTHACERVVDWCAENVPELPDVGQTPFAIAVSNPAYLAGDAVSSYRAYYIAEKARFAEWEPRAREPEWWCNRPRDGV